MRDAKRISIQYNKTIYEALRQLEATRERLLICVDKQGRLKGVINDGDMRRAFLAGAKLQDKVSLYMQKKPVFVNDKCNFNEAMRYITDRVNVVPAVNSKNRVVGYYSFKEKQEFSNIKMRNVTIFGMGYVGVTLAAVLAERGFTVTGYDIDEGVLTSLRQGRPHFYEKGLKKYLEHLNNSNLKFVSDLNRARASIYIIAVGTPVDKKTKKPNTEHLLKAVRDIAKFLECGDLVVVRSTVPLGFCRGGIIPTLEKGSGLKVGKDFFFACAPERTAEGVALLELRTNPQIVGGYDEKSTELASRFFNSITHSVIDVESLEAAEMCKLVDNCFRDHMFSFVNQLVPLCEHLSLDLCKIVDSVNRGYQRNYIPKPSPGVGGPCLSKDPYILSDAFKKTGVDCSLIKNVRRVNESGPLLLKNKLEKLLKSLGKDLKSSKIFLIGMAFKGHPETSDLRESTSVWFKELLSKNKKIFAYDKVVDKNDIAGLGLKPVDLKGGFKNADAVVILNNHSSYQDMDIFELVKTMNKPAVLIDTWHIFDPQDFRRIEGLVYGGLGND